ncbi:hypothetical protein W97_01025 [Coniosporium apollinis CBS 100218]|uniref:Uncharacterized protein n=1 Tax=Coniosporium apollinis (strain CBS 100218) TaxID=1168221 RepID=R7YIU4_CONA1|nr:uncharacterized protein W97_01025 [Coniosporium apollinis CBS 100218]EON61808.1 hypothetical protein W97_01025 [Coniosporium apollinis CBS 100218]
MTHPDMHETEHKPIDEALDEINVRLGLISEDVKAINEDMKGINEDVKSISDNVKDLHAAFAPIHEMITTINVELNRRSRRDSGVVTD